MEILPTSARILDKILEDPYFPGQAVSISLLYSCSKDLQGQGEKPSGTQIAQHILLRALSVNGVQL